MEYMTVAEKAKEWNISDRRIRVLCAEELIEGAQKLGSIWLIPKISKKPQDRRIKNKGV